MKIIVILLMLTSFMRLYSVDMSTNNAFTLFPTKIDTMSDLYEFPFTNSLNVLTNDLIFFNFNVPIIGVNATNDFVEFDFGYHSEGSMPFSMLINFRYAPRNVEETLPYQIFEPSVSMTRVEYNSKPLGVDPIGGSISFLMEINDSVSTGIVINFEYTNNLISSSNVFYTNLVPGSSDTTETSYLNNTPSYTLDVNIPIYYTSDIYKHYFEVGTKSVLTGYSNGMIHKENGTPTEERINIDFNYIVSPYISYTFGYQIKKDVAELKINTKVDVDIIIPKINTFKSILSPITEKTQYSNKYNPAVNFDINAGVLVQYITSLDWLVFRAFPTLGYSLNTKPVQTESIINTDISSSVSRNPFTSTEYYGNEVYLYVPMAFSIYEESWPVGFILASYFRFSYEYIHEDIMNYSDLISTSEDRIMLDGTINYNQNWDYDIKTQLGFFIPINNYQIEGGVNFNRDFSFESVDIRFSIPLGLDAPKDKTPIKDKDTPKDKTPVKDKDIPKDKDTAEDKKPVEDKTPTIDEDISEDEAPIIDENTSEDDDFLEEETVAKNVWWKN